MGQKGTVHGSQNYADLLTGDQRSHVGAAPIEAVKTTHDEQAQVASLSGKRHDRGSLEDRDDAESDDVSQQSEQTDRQSKQLPGQIVCWPVLQLGSPSTTDGNLTSPAEVRFEHKTRTFKMR